MSFQRTNYYYVGLLVTPCLYLQGGSCCDAGFVLASVPALVLFPSGADFGSFLGPVAAVGFLDGAEE